MSDELFEPPVERAQVLEWAAPAGNFLSFIIPGEPRAQARPRSRIVKTKGGAEFVAVYKDGKSRTFESYIRALAAQQWGNRAPLDDCPIFVCVDAYRLPPKSLPKAKYAAALDGLVRPLVKPDVDNYAKVVDALTGLVWRDDSLIVEQRARKFYSDWPRLEIAIRWQ